MMKFDLPDSVSADDDANPPQFMSTSIQPLSAIVIGDEEQEIESLLDTTLPPSSPRLGLDLDLSQPGNESEKMDFDAESDANFFAQFTADNSMGPTAATTPALKQAGGTDDFIDFDSFDSSVNGKGQKKLPRP